MSKLFYIQLDKLTMRRGQANWQVIALIVAVLFLLIMLLFVTQTREGMTELASLIQQKMRFT